MDKKLQIFDSQFIRSAWNEEEGQYYFSIVDVVRVLAGSKNPTDYLKKLRKRDAALGDYIGTNCPYVAMQTATGKSRKTLAANTEQLLRIIQSVPSPKAEPLKLWLAQTGADHLLDIADAQKLQAELDLRIQTRNDVREHNKSLAKAAQDSGVSTSEEFAHFQNSGYRGLYKGETAAAIKRRKNLKKTEDILDNMGSEELAANLFRITQAEAKLRREWIRDKSAANRVHFEVGHAVRQAIKELGGTMPEELPTPEKSIKQIEKESQKWLELKKK